MNIVDVCVCMGLEEGEGLENAAASLACQLNVIGSDSWSCSSVMESGTDVWCTYRNGPEIDSNNRSTELGEMQRSGNRCVFIVLLNIN